MFQTLSPFSLNGKCFLEISRNFDRCRIARRRNPVIVKLKRQECVFFVLQETPALEFHRKIGAFELIKFHRKNIAVEAEVIRSPA